MKRIANIFLLLFLSACSSSFNQGLVDLGGAKTLADLQAALAKVTVADLDAATARATAGNDVIGAVCYPILKKYVEEGLPGVGGQNGVAGVFDAFEMARLQQNSSGGGLAQQLPNDLRIGCSALILDTQNFIVRMMAVAGSKGAMPPGMGL